MVTVVGLGFVGLTTALGFAEYGHQVYGIECNPQRMAQIQNGQLPFLEPGLDEALQRHLGKNFHPTSDWAEAVANSSFIYYCVGTPYGSDGAADLSYLYEAMEQTLAVIRDDRFRVLVTKSTIPPATTEQHIIPFLQAHGLQVPAQLGVANNPEFLREGHCWEDFSNPDRIVIGVSDARSETMLRSLYEKESAPVYCVSLNTGEFIKYLSNTALAMLISFSNEMSLAADKIGGIDIAEAFRIVHLDKRWQTGSIRSYLYPGCGYGGYCLPKDTNAFYARAKSHGFEAKILHEVIATNDHMPQAATDRILAVAGEDRAVSIGILGLSFNVGSDDVRDTPAAKIIRLLNQAGYTRLTVYDPVAEEPFAQAYPELVLTYAKSCEEVLEHSQVLAITTAWPEFWDLQKKTDRPIVDCRYML